MAGSIGSAAGVGRLIVFVGLPGVGKTTLARATADALGATFLRIDTIETAVAAAGLVVGDAPVGYMVAGWVAADQLRSGRTVVADAVNNVAVARDSWRELGADHGADVYFVHVVISDRDEHRRRIESREPDLPGHATPSWAQVEARAWEELQEPHLSLENVGPPPARVREILAWVNAGG